jgi:hypothetical protein
MEVFFSKEIRAKAGAAAGQLPLFWQLEKLTDQLATRTSPNGAKLLDKRIEAISLVEKLKNEKFDQEETKTAFGYNTDHSNPNAHRLHCTAYTGACTKARTPRRTKFHRHSTAFASRQKN